MLIRGLKQPGKILCEEAYAQGKMLNHESWRGKLPRGVRPSDIDMCFDDNGAMIVCELSRLYKKFTELGTGQNGLYVELALKGMFACLLNHSVPSDRQIDTYSDIDWFSVMFLDNRGVMETGVYEGSRWPGFVALFYSDRQLLKEKLSRDAETQVPTPWKEWRQ